MESSNGNGPIQQIDPASGSILGEYASPMHCAAALGISAAEVLAVISDKLETSQGNRLRFKHEEDRLRAVTSNQNPADAAPAEGERRKRKRNTKFTNYAKTQIEGGGSDDSDLDLDALKDSDSDGEAAPRRKYKPRAKDPQQERVYSRANADVYVAQMNARNNGNSEQRRWGSPASLSPPPTMQGVTVRMEPGNDLYTLTDGVPNWVDYDVQYEECGSRVLESVLARRKIDRSLPNNGTALKKGPLPHVSPSKILPAAKKKAAAAAAAAAAAEPNEDDDDDEDDEDPPPYLNDGVDIFKERYAYEYQCKFKGRSFRHLEWRSAEELETLAFRAKQQFHRYLKKLQQAKEDGEDDDGMSGLEPYGEVWDVERILAKRVVETEVPDEAKRPPPELVSEASTPAAVSSSSLQFSSASSSSTSSSTASSLFSSSSSLSIKDSLSLSTTAVSVEESEDVEAFPHPLARQHKPRTGDDDTNKTLTPLDRCTFLLERFEQDPLCEPFLFPVDQETFSDYEEHVSNPMDLGTVRFKLEDTTTKGYREEVSFARDMRSVWTNCKRYNHHTSAIWWTADFCQKAFERLFQAWVLAFLPPNREEAMAELRDKNAKRGGGRGTAPGATTATSLSLFSFRLCKNKQRRLTAARPWEQSCRVCEDPSENAQDPTLLCDHCDAQYHLGCLTPKVKALPNHSWWCPVCANEPVKGQSAALEEGSSAEMDTMALPKKTVAVVEYLVKFLGRSYGDCAWETAADINDDAIVRAFETGVVVAEDEVGYGRMANEFRNGFVKAVGNKTFTVPFQAPVLKPCPRVPHEQLTDIVPMPVTDASWACRTDRPEPVSGNTCHLLHQFRPPGSENPVANATAQLFAQIKLLHYLTHSEPIAPGVQANLSLLGNDEKTGTASGPAAAAAEGKEVKGLPPTALLLTAGPATAAQCLLERHRQTSPSSPSSSSSLLDSTSAPPSSSVEAEAVAGCLAELVEHVVRGTTPKPPGPHPCRIGEYDVVIPKLPTGFHLNIFEDDGAVKVATLRALADGSFCPANVVGVGIGDALSRINGKSVTHLPFSAVCALLGALESGHFVYLRFLRAKVEPEIRPDMVVEHRGHPDYKEPGEPSSKYRGVFKRGNEWEVAVCLHPSKAYIHMLTSQSLPLPKSLYFVMGVTSDEVQGAMAYDHHAQALAQEIKTLPWRHLGNRPMIAFEQQMYTPSKPFVLNYGNFGYYSQLDENPEAGARNGAAAESSNSGRPKTKKKKSEGGEDSDDYVESGEEGGEESSEDEESDSDEAEDPVDLEISTGPANSDSDDDNDEEPKEKSAPPRDVKNGAAAAASSSSTPADEEEPSSGGASAAEPSSAKAIMADDNGDDEDDDGDDDLDDEDEDSDGAAAKRIRKTKQVFLSDAKAAKAALRAKEKRAKRLVVLESEWLSAGQMERLLLAVERCPHKPQSKAWSDTGLEPPRDLAKEAEEAKEAAAKAAASAASSSGGEGGGKELGIGQPVAQIDLDTGKLLKVWPSGNTAAKHIGVPLGVLRDACSSGAEIAGFRWEPFVAAGDENGSSSSSSSSLTPKKKERQDGVFQYAESRTYKGSNKLRDYQLSGLNWLLLCHHYKRSCILADEMGLGKTVQVVSFLEHLCTVDKLRGPFLVVVPLSTVGHWEREFSSWTDLSVCMYHDGGKDMRALIRAFEWYRDGRAGGGGNGGNRLKFQVLITTYDEVIKDVDQLGSVPWRGLIVDEAHRLKGVTSKLLESLNQILPLGVQQHGTQHRLLMTGTPLQNNTKELWSLLNFIEPSKFTSLENFQETYEEMDSEYQVRSLQQRLAPHLLRRVKEDVATDIPAKYETVIDVELTTIQKQYYRAIFEKNQAFLARAARGAVVPKLMNIQMELRKCCNHPYLIEGVEAREADLLQEDLIREAQEAQTASSSSSSSGTRGLASSPLSALMPTDSQFKKQWLERCLLRSSGKMVLLDKLLPKLRREGHKVLIFSQMTRIMNILEDFCEYRNFNVERLDGSIIGSKRQQAIDRFNNNDDAFVFLLSTRAGGVGINLCAADTCIIFDSDWNPQNDVQAQARCHRIGQTKEVMVYRLITRKSFESEMFERASLKLGLERASSSGEIKLSQNEMEKLLRQGAYAMAEDDSEANAFCEGDIDSILEQRSRVRKVEAGRTAGWLNKKSKLQGLQNKVTKTSFTSSSATANADVSVDDPNFWAKVMPNMKNAAMLKDQLTALAGVEEPDPDTVKTLVKEIQEVAAEAMERAAKGSTKLSDVERRDLQDLLLRVSCSGELVGEEARADAEATREALEGKRRRTQTQQGANATKQKSKSKRGLSRGGAAEAGGGAATTKRTGLKGGGDDYEDDEEDEEEEDEDDDEEALDEEDGDGAEKAGSSKKNKTPGKKGAKSTATKEKKANTPKAKPTPKEKKVKTPKTPKDPKTPKAKKGSATTSAPTPFEGVDLPDLATGNGGSSNGASSEGGKRRSKANKKAIAAAAMGDDDDDDGLTDEDDLLPAHKPKPSSNGSGSGSNKKRSRTPPPSDTASSGKTKKEKKHAVVAVGDEEEEEEEEEVPTAVAIPPRQSCEEWPAWAEPATAKELKRLCVAILDDLLADEDVEDVFGFPVPEDTPLYAATIPEPMDLGAMHDAATAGEYETLERFRFDLRLVIDNCLTFNMDGSEFFQMAHDLAGGCHDAYLKARGSE